MTENNPINYENIISEKENIVDILTSHVEDIKTLKPKLDMILFFNNIIMEIKEVLISYNKLVELDMYNDKSLNEFLYTSIVDVYTKYNIDLTQGKNKCNVCELLKLDLDKLNNIVYENDIELDLNDVEIQEKDLTDNDMDDLFKFVENIENLENEIYEDNDDIDLQED